MYGVSGGAARQTFVFVAVVSVTNTASASSRTTTAARNCLAHRFMAMTFPRMSSCAMVWPVAKSPQRPELRLTLKEPGRLSPRLGFQATHSRLSRRPSRRGRVANSDLRRETTSTVLLLCFVRLGKSEADPEQLVLLAHGPHTGKAEALAQPQYRLEAADRAPCRVERAEPAHAWHGSFHSE